MKKRIRWTVETEIDCPHLRVTPKGNFRCDYGGMKGKCELAFKRRSRIDTCARICTAIGVGKASVEEVE